MVKVGEMIEIEYSVETKEGNKIDEKRSTTIFGLGFLPNFIEDLIKDKEPGEYSFEIKGEDIFGKRNPNLIQIIKLKYFKKSGINPYPGMWVEIDGTPGKVLSVSGGRVVVDFNNPLIGKDLMIKVKFKKLDTPLEEKINFLSTIVFGRRINFELRDSKVFINDTVDQNLLEMFVEYLKKMGLEVEKNG